MFTATCLYASETHLPDGNLDTLESDQALLDELMGIVDESTAIATKTKMNTHFVPGTVTVLKGKDMEALGATTAWDALALVPGILPSKDATGGTSVIARGLNFPFSSGNIKILVNALAMNQESSGINSSTLQIPIEHIQRIEVVRGPGAILYGDNAFMGLVNIVTYSDKQRAFMRYESAEAISGGAMGSYQNDQHQLKIHGNAYGFGNNQADTHTQFNTEENRQFGIFSLAYQGFSFKFQSFHRNMQQVVQNFSKDGNDIFSAQQQLSITPELSTELSFSYLLNDFKRANQSYRGGKIKSAFDINWTGLKDHNWWLKFTYTSEAIDNAFLRQARLPGQPVASPLNLSDINRDYLSLSLQDQYDISDALTLTVGLRYDYRNDLNKHIFTPRVSAVWRISDAHILKVQYAEGFRVPTFFELYTQTGQHDLTAEKIATSEISYIFHQTAHTGKITFFYSQLSDMIFPMQRQNFRNQSKAQNWGVELEWEQQLTNTLKWQANVSYVDSWDTRTSDGRQQADQAATHWLSNISVFYRPIDQVLLAAHWHYTGQRHKPNNINVPAENRLALTLSTFDIFTKGLSFKVGVQNALSDNEQYVYVTPQRNNVLDYGNHAIAWTQISYAL